MSREEMIEYFVDYVKGLIVRGYGLEMIKRKLELDYGEKDAEAIIKLVEMAGVQIPRRCFLTDKKTYLLYPREVRLLRQKNRFYITIPRAFIREIRCKSFEVYYENGRICLIPT